MKTIHYYAILLTLTTAATLALCDSNPSEEKASPVVLPFENSQRVERSPKYGKKKNHACKTVENLDSRVENSF